MSTKTATMGEKKELIISLDQSQSNIDQVNNELLQPFSWKDTDDDATIKTSQQEAAAAAQG